MFANRAGHPSFVSRQPCLQVCLTALLFLYSWMAAAGDVAQHIEVLQKRKPNFVVILLDDLGLHDTGFMGNDFIETPAIDRLAHDGVVFSHAYANAPNCAPSRAAIISGQYAQRTGVYTMVTGDVGDAARRKVQTPKNSMHLPEQVYTIAELLHDHGYATAHIGKWNLGTGMVRGPQGQGFDINIGGYRGGVESYYAPYSKELPGLKDAPPGEYLTDRLNAEALQFVRQHRQQPFFLYLSHFAPHFPIQAPHETVEKYEKKRDTHCGKNPVLRYCEMTSINPEYAAMVERIDSGVAALRDALREEHLADNTVIVLMSDNGGYALAHDPQALRGQKSQLYEGGIRVPMIWLLPNQSAGITRDEPVSGLDIYPTFAALAGIDTHGLTLDGNDISPLFSHAGKIAPRALYWYFPAYTQDSDAEEIDNPESARQAKHFYQTPAAVILREGWKLIRYYDGSPPALYNLQDDPLEKDNRYAREKKRGALLMADLESWLQKSGGLLTLPLNPSYVAADSPAGQ